MSTNETIFGRKESDREALKQSKTTTYRNKYVHVEMVEDDYYQLHISDMYIGDDSNSDVVSCYRNGKSIYPESYYDDIDDSNDIGGNDSMSPWAWSDDEY